MAETILGRDALPPTGAQAVAALRRVAPHVEAAALADGLVQLRDSRPGNPLEAGEGIVTGFWTRLRPTRVAELYLED